MLEMMKDLAREFLADDELFELMAKVMKKAHSALVKEGFTQEEATKIVAGQGAGIKANP